MFFRMWFNRQEAAETHCSVTLFLLEQNSQVSLWVCVFFSNQFENMSLLFVVVIISLVCYATLMLESPVRCDMIKHMLDDYVFMMGEHSAEGDMSFMYCNEKVAEAEVDFCLWGDLRAVVSRDVTKLASLISREQSCPAKAIKRPIL